VDLLPVTAAPKPTFFATPAHFRRWLERNHAKAGELWVGFHKKASGRPSITWPESVDEALCFGWIDGVRYRIDESSYRIRFTPRTPKSIWSNVNVKRVAALKRLGRMSPAGLAAFAKADPKRAGIYAYERSNARLGAAHQKKLKANKTAWDFFRSQPPWYQRLAAWFVVSAKKEETRARRVEVLIAHCAAGRRLGPAPPLPRRGRG
jgi:uncharacterized protein YdeI (YjbR/CyaY-like superfamily)